MVFFDFNQFLIGVRRFSGVFLEICWFFIGLLVFCGCQVNGNKGRNLTAIAAVSTAGLLHYKLVDGPANGEIF